MLFGSENTLQLHTKLTVLFWVSIKILFYEEVQNSPMKIYSWEEFDLTSRMDILIFFTASIRGQILKNHFLKTQSELNIDLKKVGLTKEPSGGAEASLTPSPRWEEAGAPESSSSSSLGSCPVQSQSPDNTSARSTDGSPSSICP